MPKRRSYPRPPIEERLWNRVQKTETCWVWTGATVQGYGVLKWNGKQVKAHRVAWILTHGDIPDGRFVCHNCPGGDNPRCVNPAHLWLGDVLDNTSDAARKGRMRWGPSHYRSKLTADEVRAIRAAYGPGCSYRRLGEQYRVNPYTIWMIVKGLTWKGLTHSSTPTIP